VQQALTPRSVPLQREGGNWGTPAYINGQMYNAAHQRTRSNNSGYYNSLLSGGPLRAGTGTIVGNPGSDAGDYSNGLLNGIDVGSAVRRRGQR